MKIMFLIFSFNTGGIERLLIDMCNTMSAQGHSVTLCVINKDYELPLLDELSPAVTRLLMDRPMGDSNKLSYMRQLARIIRKEKYDILHCQGLNCVLFSILAKLYFPHVKLLNTVHDVNNFPRYTRMQIFFHNTLCSHIIAISETVKQEILARGTKPRMVSTIYNAIDTERFCLCEHPHIKHAKAQSITHSEPITIGNVARIMPAKKGQLVLLQAINHLKERFPAIHCYFAGDVASNCEEQFQELQEYVHCNHLENHVTFLGNVKDVPKFLATLDVFVLPSFYEGFGISLIEALATGIPSIASKLDGPAEIMESPALGTLFTPGDTNELADKLTDMIAHYENYKPNIISQTIIEKYSISTLVEQHIQIYKSCHKPQ